MPISNKINHITDPFMVNKLYEASQAGVDIQLVVRGNCSLITGIEGVSAKYPDKRYHRPLSGTFPVYLYLHRGEKRKSSSVRQTGCHAT